jgi:hypothetical protein
VQNGADERQKCHHGPFKNRISTIVCAIHICFLNLELEKKDARYRPTYCTIHFLKE